MEKAMNRHQLKELIDEGESAMMEFKRKFTSPEKMAKEIMAFANTKGGFLLVGVDDDGSIVGVESEKEVEEMIKFACRFHIEPPLEPQIEIVQIEYRDVIVVFVARSNRKPHRLIAKSPAEQLYHNKAYIRQADKSIAASREMEKILAGQNADAPALTVSVGKKEQALFKYLEQNERVTVKTFAKLVNISERWASRLIVRLVRAGVLQIHTEQGADYYTLV